LKLSVYVFVFLLPFGMAMLALLIYLDRRSRSSSALAPRSAVLPAALPPSDASASVTVSSTDNAPGAKRAPTTRKIQHTSVPRYCSGGS
jgi:hypothetical protein